MSHVWAVVIGGALGSVLRFWMSNGIYNLLGRNFPYGTLAVNVAGCLLMGLFSALFLERVNADSLLRAGILIGVLGGFTTFSSFSIETFNLIEESAHLKAAANIIGSVLLCVGATWVGVILGRQL